MKLIMKKSLSVLLSVLLALSVFGVLAFAADTEDAIENENGEAVVDEIEEAEGAEAVEEEPNVCEYCGQIHDTNKIDGFFIDFFHDFLFIVKAVTGAPAKALEEKEEAETEAPAEPEEAEEAEEAEVCEYCGETHDVNKLDGFVTDFMHDFLFIVKSLVNGFAHFFDAPATEAETELAVE